MLQVKIRKMATLTVRTISRPNMPSVTRPRTILVPLLAVECWRVVQEVKKAANLGRSAVTVAS